MWPAERARVSDRLFLTAAATSRHLLRPLRLDGKDEGVRTRQRILLLQPALVPRVLGTGDGLAHVLVGSVVKDDIVRRAGDEGGGEGRVELRGPGGEEVEGGRWGRRRG